MGFEYELPPGFKGTENKEDFGKFSDHPESPSCAGAKEPPVRTGDEKQGHRDAGQKEPDRPADLRFSLAVMRHGPAPAGPIALNAWTKITEPEKFIQATLADLAAYVAAKNAGQHHWTEDLL
jgi:hypothetical protein